MEQQKLQHQRINRPHNHMKKYIKVKHRSCMDIFITDYSYQSQLRAKIRQNKSQK
jgi:hypothetical protein